MTEERTAKLPWSHPAWYEDEKDWARGCRLLQGWWRSQLDVGSVGAGLSTPVGSNPPKLVVSMLRPEEARCNFLSDSAWRAFEAWSTDGSGLVGDDRARRNLLSSQPLAFNLFGPFTDDPRPLLPWVRTVDADASLVDEVRLEWAPRKHTTFGGGSAFDVFISYSAGHSPRFLGVECKYAENLSKSSIKSILTFRYGKGARKGQRPQSYENYQTFTESSGYWREGAVSHLDEVRLRQIWLNALLAQRVSEIRSVDQGTSVMLACQDDHDAWAATKDVRSQLVNPAHLRWSSYEAVLGTLHRVEWAPEFVKRYLDFSPVEERLPAHDPRRLALDT